MRKSFTAGADRQGEWVGVQIPLGLLESLEDVREGFFSLCVSAGRQVLTAMMERDREALCGPKWIPNAQRRAHRAGTIRSEVTLGGRRIPMQRLRARSTGGHELRLPSFGFASSRDPLDARTLEAIAIGVSTRKYHRSLDPLPSEDSERSVGRSCGVASFRRPQLPAARQVDESSPGSARPPSGDHRRNLPGRSLHPDRPGSGL